MGFEEREETVEEREREAFGSKEGCMVSSSFSSQKAKKDQTLDTSSLRSSLWGQGGQLLTSQASQMCSSFPRPPQRGLDTFGKTHFDTLISESLSKIPSFLIRNKF